MKRGIRQLGGTPVSSAKPQRSLDEVDALGQAIYDRVVKPALGPDDQGKFVAIDVESSDFEIDQDDYSAIMRLRSRRPDADIWLMRAGYRAAYQIGGAR
jgi:hypothetical protein